MTRPSTLPRPTRAIARPRQRGPGVLVAVCVAILSVKVGLHVFAAVATPYEFHRDELLYFSMGAHLQLFRMDFPPLIALASEALRHTVGVSVFTYRLFPGLVGTLLTGLTLLAVLRLGGGVLALALTAAAMLSSPLLLRASSLFQPVVLDQLWWTAALYALLRLEQTGDRRWWLALGLAGGAGLLTKFTIFFLGVGVLAGLLLTPLRRSLAGPWPWMAAGVALLVGSPSLLGQVSLGWPIFDQMDALYQGQLYRVTWREYLGSQPLMLGPGIGLAVAGAAVLLRGSLSRYRALGIACIAAFLLLGLLRGKPYYAGPVYPLLLAAGAVWVEGLARRRLRTAVAVALLGLSLAYGVACLPLGLPVLPPESMARYAAALGVQSTTRTNQGEQLTLPQDYADMLGWREKADAAARAVASLTPEERDGAVLYGANYGQAGALDLYGRRLGLPPVVSLAGSFYLFGPGDRPGEIVIFLGVEAEALEEVGCRSLALFERLSNPWGVPEERDVPVLICRDPGVTLQEVWRARGPSWG